MKMVKLAAAIALGLTPALAFANDTTVAANSSIEPGGISQTGAEGLPILGTIPAGAIVVGGLVILGGVIIGVAAATDDDDTSTSTTTTN